MRIPHTILVNPGDPMPDLTSFQGSLDFPQEQLRLTVTNLGISSFLRVILADNAFLPDAVCPALTFSSMLRGVSVWKLLGKVLNGLTPENIRVYASEIERRHPRHGTDRLLGADGQQVHRTDKPANMVFFSTAVGRVPPLEKIPPKWALSHVMQVLANGQCSSAHRAVPCPREEYTGSLTKFVETTPLALLDELMEPKRTGTSCGLDLRYRWNPVHRTMTLMDEWSTHSIFTLTL
ncbi:hypothetical protein G3A43_07900 [Paraburkholderia aspalathi]|nr:hypothetical protein [Paraburkholderia aspalathi]MBK3780178.1 hypothetical protein [Paraburkholderia aspalathi]